MWKMHKVFWFMDLISSCNGKTYYFTNIFHISESFFYVKVTHCLELLMKTERNVPNNLIVWLGREDYFLMWSESETWICFVSMLKQGYFKFKAVSVLVCTAAFGSTSLWPHLSICALSLCHCEIKSNTRFPQKESTLAYPRKELWNSPNTCLSERSKAWSSCHIWTELTTWSISVAVALLCVTTWSLISIVSAFSRCSYSKLDTGFCFCLLVAVKVK